MIKKYFFIFFLLILLTNTIFSQDKNKTTPPDTEQEVDTVYIDKAPYIIRQTVHVNTDTIVVNTKYKYLEAFVTPMANVHNYYNYCQSCQPYFTNIKNSISSGFNYSVGLTYFYTNKRLYLSAGLAFTHITENFHNFLKNQNTISTNTFNYADFIISCGYRLVKGKISFIPEVGFIASPHLSSSGQTISEQDDTTTVDINSHRRYSYFSYSVMLGVKILVNVSDKISLSYEPTYIGNLRTVISWNEPFVQQRNFAGLRLGIVYKFN